MQNGKRNTLSLEQKKFNIAQSYLENGMFDKAKEIFKEIETCEELTSLIYFALKLCEYSIEDIVIEETSQFYEKMVKLSLEKKDVILYKKAFANCSQIDNEDVNEQKFVENLQKFKLIDCLNFDELKIFVEDFKEKYFYYDVLIKIVETYIEKRRFVEATYFIEQIIEKNIKNTQVLFGLVLCKMNVINEEEILHSPILLSTLPEFDELLLYCDDDDERSKYVKLVKTQEETLKKDEEIRILEQKRQEWMEEEYRQREIEANLNIIKGVFGLVWDFIKSWGILILMILLSWGSVLILHYFVGGVLGLVLAFVVPIVSVIVGNVLLESKFESGDDWIKSVSTIVSGISIVFYMVVSASEPIWGFESGVAAWGIWNYLTGDNLGWLHISLPYVITVIGIIVGYLTSSSGDTKPIIPIILCTAGLCCLTPLVNVFSFEYALEIGVVIRFVGIIGGFIIGYFISDSCDFSGFGDSFGDFFKSWGILILMILLSWGSVLILHYFVGGVLGLVLAFIVPIVIVIVGNALLYYEFDSGDDWIKVVSTIVSGISIVFYMVVSASEPIWGFESGVAAWGIWNYLTGENLGWLHISLPYVITVIGIIGIISTELRKAIIPIILCTAGLCCLTPLVNVFSFEYALELGVVIRFVGIIGGFIIGCIISHSCDF